MAVTPVRVCQLSVVAIALFAVAVNAVTYCDQKIISRLSQIKECYENGAVPNQRGLGKQGVVVTKAHRVPDNTRCVTAYQKKDKYFTTIQTQKSKGDRVKFSATSHDLVFNKDHILETDSQSNKYRMYVIHNKDEVYSYYKCIAERAAGSGGHGAEIVVGCGFEKDAKAVQIVNKAKSCFAQLGITNTYNPPTCECSRDV